MSSGHSAVKVGSSYVLVFGGLVDKKFLNDLIVYDIGKLDFSTEQSRSSKMAYA